MKPTAHSPDFLLPHCLKIPSPVRISHLFCPFSHPVNCFYLDVSQDPYSTLAIQRFPNRIHDPFLQSSSSPGFLIPGMTPPSSTPPRAKLLLMQHFGLWLNVTCSGRSSCCTLSKPLAFFFQSIYRTYNYILICLIRFMLFSPLDCEPGEDRECYCSSGCLLSNLHGLHLILVW